MIEIYSKVGILDFDRFIDDRVHDHDHNIIIAEEHSEPGHSLSQGHSRNNTIPPCNMKEGWLVFCVDNIRGLLSSGSLGKRLALIHEKNPPGWICLNNMVWSLLMALQQMDQVSSFAPAGSPYDSRDMIEVRSMFIKTEVPFDPQLFDWIVCCGGLKGISTNDLILRDMISSLNSGPLTTKLFHCVRASRLRGSKRGRRLRRQLERQLNVLHDNIYLLLEFLFTSMDITALGMTLAA